MKKFQEHIEETVNPEDVDLKSFDLQDRLNPEFWNGDRLNPYIRRALLMIARDFIADLSFDIDPEDVIFTGSLANYNWSKEYSDIDLHILVDFNAMEVDKDILDKLFKSIKTIWNAKHEELRIAGYPVELYVQDTKEEHKSTGIYSLLHDEWIVKPELEKIENDDLDTDEIQNKAAEYCNKIEDLEERLKSESDPDELEIIYDESEILFDDIKKERSAGMMHDKPELSVGNLIFKALRRNGYIERLLKLRSTCYDRLRSFY